MTRTALLSALSSVAFALFVCGIVVLFLAFIACPQPNPYQLYTIETADNTWEDATHLSYGSASVSFMYDDFRITTYNNPTVTEQ